MERQSVIFKAMYWSFEDTEENKLIIHVSGMTAKQKTVYLQIEHFTPYAYLQLPDKIKWTNDKCRKLFEYFRDKTIYKPLMYRLKKKQILHFREEGNFMFLTFSTNRDCRKFEGELSKKNFIPGVGTFYNGDLKIHEHNIDPILKFTAMKKIQLANWICAKETIHEDEIGLSVEERRFSTGDIDLFAHYKDVEFYDMKETVILHPVYCSFDIECNSQNHNSKLPDPKNPENEVFQISMVFGRMGLPEQKNYLLSRFDPLDIEDSKVIRFKTEKELLLYFSKLIRKKDPLFFIGYNIMKFDWTYMITRAEKYLPRFLDISRIVGKKAGVCSVNWSSSAYGEQDYKYPDCYGRVQLDVILEVERNYRLPSYSLDNVAEKFLGDRKDDITPRQLFMFYKITKDLIDVVSDKSVDIIDVQKQIKHILPLRKTHGVVRKHRHRMLKCSNRKELHLLIRECLTMTLKYCKQDTILPIRLVEKLNLLTTMEEMSNVMHVPMSYLHTRGQQIKVLAQIFRETIGENLVIPYNKKDPKAVKEDYEGAIVVEAHAGDYTNVGTLDFCITGDTLISAGNGLCVPLKDITKEHKVIGWNGNSYNEYSHLGVVYKGEKETVIVWLQDGSTIKCTPDHKFILDNGEKCRADELEGKYVKCGDYKDGKYKVARKKVIGIYKNGIEPVYDIFNVDQVHNFLAGGISVMNCSLYPTTMMAFNICYTTLVRDNSIPDEDCHVLEWSSHVGCPHDPQKRKKKKGDRVIMVCGDFKCRFLRVKYIYDEKTGIFIRQNEGIMPKLERNLLTSRKEVKKEMFKAESRLNMNRGECTDEDIQFFRKCGFEIIEKNSLSKEEDKILETIVGILNAKQLAIKVSANSIDEDTPVLCLIDENIVYKQIKDLFVEEKSFKDEKNNEYFMVDKNIKVWSDEGWANVKYVFRHKLKDENMFEIQATTGIVEVTEDHSLLDECGSIMTCKDLYKNKELLSMDLPLPKDTPDEPLFRENILFDLEEIIAYEKGINFNIEDDLLNSPYKIRAAFIMGYCKNNTNGYFRIKNKLEAAKMYFLLESVGYKVCTQIIEKEYILNFSETNKLPCYLVKIKKYDTCKDKYVYDIETSSHHFAAGIGDIIVHNSAYGALGADQGFVPLIKGAASVTAMGRKLITLAVEKIKKEWSNCKLIYGDSVVGDTPIMVRDENKNIHMLNIENLQNLEKEEWKDFPLFKLDGELRTSKSRIDISRRLEIWTKNGWSKIKRLIKHRVNKKIYRVSTECGIVDVTEDHSLLRADGSHLKPKDALIGDELLHSFPKIENYYYSEEKDDILNGSYEVKMDFLRKYKSKDCFIAENKLLAQKIYYLVKSCFVYFTPKIKFNDGLYIIELSSFKTPNSYCIKNIELLYETYDDFVYDIETESGQFHAGVGELIIKNTDSCMLFFENCTLKECFENCEKASKIVTHYLKTWILGIDENYTVYNTKSGEFFSLNKITSKSKEFKDLSYEHKIKVIEYESIPTDLAFEKVYGRFLLLTKKRYIAYTVNKDGKIIETTKKGVVLTRRDNSQSLRTTYKKLSDGILDRREEKDVMYELYDEIHKLFTRQIPETNFIIYLGVKKIIDYAKKKKFEIGNKTVVFFIDAKGEPIDEPCGPLDPRLVYPNLPQVLLSLKLLNRGTDVPANTRLEHIYVENSAAVHQGQKAEDFTYYKENKDVEGFKIDYLHYLEKLQAPITELLNVKYPRRDIVLYEKLDDAVKRILSCSSVDEYKRITLSRTNTFTKTVEEYDKYEIGWKCLMKGKIKKFITQKMNECCSSSSREIIIPRVYTFKGVNAKIEYIISSSKGSSLNDFTYDNPVEREMIEISKTYKSHMIIDKLHSQYKAKKRTMKKPTQIGEKLIKTTKVKIVKGEYKEKYAKIYDLHEIIVDEDKTKKIQKKYTFDVILDDSQKIIQDIPRDHLVSYRYRDNSVMKDIYNARFFYKCVVSELNKLFNPVVFEEEC